MTARLVAGAFLALLGAVGVTASAYLDWFSDRTPESAPIERLFQSGVTEQASSYWTSVALPLAIVTFVAVIGVLLRSRLILAVGWCIGLATLVLFVAQHLNDTADFAIGDLQAGVWVAIAGLIIMLLGFTSMGGRPAPEPEISEPEPEPWPGPSPDREPEPGPMPQPEPATPGPDEPQTPPPDTGSTDKPPRRE